MIVGGNVARTLRGSSPHFLRRHHRERAEAEVEILFGFDALAHYLPQLLRRQPDAGDALLKFRLRGETAEEFGECRFHFFIFRMNVRQLLRLVIDEALIDHQLQHALQVLRARTVERRAGLECQLPQKVGVGDETAVDRRHHVIQDLAAGGSLTLTVSRRDRNQQ